MLSAFQMGTRVRAGCDWLSRNRRPATFAALAGLPLAVILGPLAVDLFYVVPWPARKAAGWVAVAALAALGLWRATTPRAGVEWPGPSGESPRGLAHRLLPWALQAAVASLGWPLLASREALPFGDWDWYVAHFEAARRSIVMFRQFPWWDPYCVGGFPLAANPQVGVVGPGMALVLMFGTSVGLRLASLGWMMLAVEGARRLAFLVLRDPWGAALAGLVYGLNGGVLIYTVAGYYIPFSYWTVPWIALAAVGLGGPWWRAAALGGWLALGILNGIHYLLVYAIVLATVLGLRTSRAGGWDRGGRVLLQAALAAGVVLTACGWRLATTGGVVRDFPRSHAPSTVQSLDYAMACWVGRPDAPTLAATSAPVFWETNTYVGWPVVGLAVISLAWGLRWWHVLAILGFWLAFGGYTVWMPSYWLNHLPIFSSLHVVSRWRLVASLGVGLAAGSAVAALRLDARRWARALGPAAVLLIGADLVGYGHEILPLAFSIPRETVAAPGPPVREIVQTLRGPETTPVTLGYGVVQGYEPLLGYDRERPTARLAVTAPGYVAEAWTDSGPVSAVEWTPNRLVFRVRPGQVVRVNQNSGSWWTVNGDRPYGDLRSAELLGTLSGVADDSGRLEFAIAPPSLGRGWALHGLGLAIIAASCAAARWWWREAPTTPG